MTLNRAARYTLVAILLLLALTALGGAIWVVPPLPVEWLAGTPFSSYTIPALALGGLGVGAAVAAGGLLFHRGWAVTLSILIGLGISIFEVVETMVVGLDVWLHALGLTATIGKGFGGADLQGIPTYLDIPLPLWLQPLYFVIGLLIVALALRLLAREPHQAVARLRTMPG